MSKASYVAAGAATLGIAAAASYAVRNPKSTLLAESFHQGVKSRRSLALTFDDGPSESTPQLLEVLARYNVRATFFQCGVNVRRLPSVCREVHAAGHEIGNHTESHPYLCLKSAVFIEQQIASAQLEIASVTGSEPRYFRAPYGVRWFGLDAAQRKHRLMGVMWTTMGLDWKLPSQRISARLLEGAVPGAIFCLHDGRTLKHRPGIRSTIDAVRQVLPVLLQEGFTFETVSEIICSQKI